MKEFSKAIPLYREVIRLKSPLSPVASLYIAKCHRLSGNSLAALNELDPLRSLSLPESIQNEIRDETLENSKVALMQGITFFDSGDYDQANRTFDSLKKIGSADPEMKEQVQMMRALSLLKSDRVEEANLELAQVSQSGKAINIKQTSGTLLRAILKSDYFGQYPWWSFVDYSAGYNTNVGGDPSSITPVKSPFHQLLGGAGKRFFKRGEYIAAISSQLTYAQFFKDSSARSLSLNLNLPLTIENPKSWKSLTPFVNYEISGPTPYLYRPGVSLGYGRKKSGRESSITYTAISKLPANASFTYARGLIHELKGTLSFIRPQELIIPTLVLGHENSDSLILSGGELPLARFYLAPGITWKRLSQSKGPPWEFAAGLAYTLSFYSPARRDGLLALDGSIGKWFSRTFKGYAGLTILQNQSSLDSGAFIDKNFKAWIATIGISWDIHQ